MGKSFRLYLVALFVVTGVLMGCREAREQIIKFGCVPAEGRLPPDGWMENCASDRIGDYSHSAFAFGLEPSVISGVEAAKVLFFGNSRLEFAVSRGDASEWFAARNIRFYLLSFGYYEQSGWAEKLLKQYRPHPAVMVFDTNNYFTGGLSQPAQAIERDPDGEKAIALATKSYIATALNFCGILPWLCGRTAAAYRSNLDGHVFSMTPERFWFGKQQIGNFPVSTPPASDPSGFDNALTQARAVVNAAGIDPKCIVFTNVPSNDQDASLARFLADQLGAKVVAPQVDGLATLDHAHLTWDSSKIWMKAFLSELQPVLQACGVQVDR